MTAMKSIGRRGRRMDRREKGVENNLSARSARKKACQMKINYGEGAEGKGKQKGVLMYSVPGNGVNTDPLIPMDTGTKSIAQDSDLEPTERWGCQLQSSCC
jgi:hypothetical protein